MRNGLLIVGCLERSWRFVFTLCCWSGARLRGKVCVSWKKRGDSTHVHSLSRWDGAILNIYQAKTRVSERVSTQWKGQGNLQDECITDSPGWFTLDRTSKAFSTVPWIIKAFPLCSRVKPNSWKGKAVLSWWQEPTKSVRTRDKTRFLIVKAQSWIGGNDLP